MNTTLHKYSTGEGKKITAAVSVEDPRLKCTVDSRDGGVHVGVVVVSRTVLFGQVHGKLVQHFSGVALQRAEKSTATVDHDEAKLAVVGQQGRQRLGGVGAGCGLDKQGKGETFRPCHEAGRKKGVSKRHTGLPFVPQCGICCHRGTERC